jgi:lysophospholipase L1-like esterase
MAGLAAIAERFVTHVRARGMEPLIAFVPTFDTDRAEAAPVVAALKERLGARAAVTAVGDEPGDWARYNIAYGCHPSAYGHGLIAAHLERALAPLLDAARPTLSAHRS